jgi:hypothetical protein
MRQLWRPRRRCALKLQVNIKEKGRKIVDLIDPYGSRYFVIAVSFEHVSGASGYVSCLKLLTR